MAENCASLSGDQLEKLVKVMYYKGVEGIHTRRFGSVYERARYLKTCRSAYLDSKEILKTTKDAINDFKDDERMSPTVDTYAGYINNLITIAIKWIDGYPQRAEYFAGVKAHTAFMIEEFRRHKVSPFNAETLAEFEKEVGKLSKAFFKYHIPTIAPRISRNIYKSIRIYASIDNLLVRFQSKLGYKGYFKEMPMSQQVEVMDEVIVSNGTGKKLAKKVGLKTMKVLGKYGARSLYLITASVAVIDIYSAEPDKRYETVVKSVVSLGSSYLIGLAEGYLMFELGFFLICTGNPVFIILGLVVMVGTFFLGKYAGDLVEKYVTPVVVNFMNQNPEVKDAVNTLLAFPQHIKMSILSLDMPILHTIAASPTAVNVIEELQLLSLICPIFSPAIILNSWIQYHKKPPIPISTFGLRIYGPQVPNGGALALQIGSKLHSA